LSIRTAGQQSERSLSAQSRADAAVDVLLISTYEMGRQPFGLASPGAWLRRAGARVHYLDLSLQALAEDVVRAADLIAFYVPMHMATRIAVRVLERVRRLNSEAHICFFGLYAAENASYLRSLSVDSVLAGEFEEGLVQLARRLADKVRRGPDPTIQTEPVISLDRQSFLVPDRSGLPNLRAYAHLVRADGCHVTVGYVEASRGCKHLCRHCPIVPVYGGRFRVVQREVVLDDISQQVAAGAGHITFGDPDFFNGVGHGIPLVRALHARHPELTYDVTIKVEHLLRHAEHLATLQETGCLFVTTAVESFDDQILEIFDKHHTARDFEMALTLCRERGLLLVPTFVAFTPWITLDGYRDFLRTIAKLDLIDQVAPIQYAIRLLIPPGSRLLELPDVRGLVEGLDQPKLSYRWRNPDPGVDDLQRDLEGIIRETAAQSLSRHDTFRKIWKRAFRDAPDASAAMCSSESRPRPMSIPYLTEPWYC
jgi:radical SAM superfamily enzyme YgiQ (UPF0313 family)